MFIKVKLVGDRTSSLCEELFYLLTLLTIPVVLYLLKLFQNEVSQSLSKNASI